MRSALIIVYPPAFDNIPGVFQTNKPILVQAPCLNCHGSREQIVPEVLQIIDKRYQNDKAVNYQIGDLRGAVSIQKVL